MSYFLGLAALILPVVGTLPLSAYAADSDQTVDYAPIISRGFGISDEPSMLNQCGPDYDGLRIVELAGGLPIAIVRVENQRQSVTAQRRTFVRGQPETSAQSQISDVDWTKLMDLLRKSGFWTYENDDSVWMPDSATLWIEACLNGKFRSVSMYPERDSRMNEITGFFASIGL